MRDREDEFAEEMSKDLLKGARAIASFIGVNQRRANYLLEMGELPAFRMGKLWHMRKSVFRTMCAQREAGSGNAA